MARRKPYDFASDNAAGIDPRILAALLDGNAGTEPPYGADPTSVGMDALYAKVFEHEAFGFIAPSGTAANGLALGAVSPPYGAIFCHEEAHVMTTECGAPEFFSGGARLVPLPGEGGRITPDTLEAALAPYRAGSLHQLRPAALSLTQPTEAGTLYELNELARLADIAHRAGMKVHMDGARFANALVGLGCSPSEMTWKAGIDVLSFGTTKNGTMNAEPVIAFDGSTAETLRYMHKRAGLLQSKMRFAALQVSAYLSDGLWIENARRANATARRLSTALTACGGARLRGDVEANEVFAHLSQSVVARLASAGIALRPWPHPQGDLVRLVASFNDAEELVLRFEAALNAAV